ncbi:MAG TPA: hypothetical protein VNY05_05030 [Candidatus Acidoferrales bacterium]|jgi:hypothetical protein|nr:hypothetical protein [Candidatus Acidoferrales bacterium]
MIVHVLKKDVRRLWPAVIVTLILLAMLAHADWWRADPTPGQTEAWLNLLLPFAWACLIALLIQEEPLVGDRQFWITRPHRWPQLLAAKLIFVLLFVHLPALAADAMILAMRGFPPLQYLPQLLGKQALLAGALTLPALAVAAVVRSFTHFVLAAFGVAAEVLFLAGFDTPFPWHPVDDVRQGLAVILLTAVAVAVIGLQYGGRRTLVSRCLAVAAALIAGAVSGYLPATSAFAVQAEVSPLHPQLSLRLVPRSEKLPPDWNRDRVMVAIPVDVSGIPAPDSAFLEQLELEIDTPAGDRQQSAPPRVQSRDFDKRLLEAYLIPWNPLNDSSGRWLELRFTRATYDRFRNARVGITARAGVTMYRPGTKTWMPVGGPVDAPGAGHCSAAVVEGRFAEQMLKVLCESPSEIPIGTRVTVWHPESGQEWKQGWGGARPYYRGLGGTWLSPLHRGMTYFNLDSSGRAEKYQIPMGALATAKISIAPIQITGYAVLPYRLDGISLAEYVVPPQPGR